MAYATLGTYTGTCYNVLGGVINGFTYKATVSYEQDIVANLTRLKITSTVACTGSTGTASTYYFKLNGNDYHHKYVNLGYGVSYTSSEVQTTVYHNTDGTKVYNLNVGLETEVAKGSNANINNGALKKATINQNITLPTIPRASSFTAPTFTCGSAGTITITPVVSSFTHKVHYSFGNASGTISSSCTTSCSWTPSNDLAKQIPNSTSGVGNITVDTYNGSTKVGSSTQLFRLYVNGSMYPTFTSLSLTGNNLLNGYYVQGKSTVTAKINGATGSYGSTITGYSISGHSLSSSSSSATSGVFTGSGNATYKATIMDSRGRTATKQQSIYVYPYSAPSVSFTLVSRADSNKVVNEQGEYVKIKIRYSITSINNANAKAYTLHYRVAGSSTWTSLIGSTTLSSYSSEDLEITTSAKISVASTYEFRIGVGDSYSTSYDYATVNTVACVLDFEQDGIGVGKYREKGMLDVAGDIYTSGKIETTGTIKATGQITSTSSVRGTTFTQSNYGLPIEIGQTIDFHNSGSSSDVDVRLSSAGTRDRLRISNGGDLTKSIDVGVSSTAVFIKNATSGQFFTLDNGDRLTYGGFTVPHNWRQSFTPFLYCDTGTFTARGSYGQAVYLGDLVFVQGRIIATRGSLTGTMSIGGLPVSNIQNYAPVTFGFFGGLYTGHPTTSVDVHGYVQQNAGHIVLNHTDRNRGGWYPLYAEYGQTGEWDITFSAVYRWR